MDLPLQPGSCMFATLDPTQLTMARGGAGIASFDLKELDEMKQGCPNTYKALLTNGTLMFLGPTRSEYRSACRREFATGADDWKKLLNR